jgi:uncharacterized protein (TIGR02246 family)
VPNGDALGEAEMDDGADRIAAELLQALERAWNAGDGPAWGARFAEDADFVTVRGEYFRTRAVIAEGHQQIFDTIYKGSVNRIELLRARTLAEGLILAHASARLEVPAGPLAGVHQAVQSLVLVRADGGWQITSFHNTFKIGDSFGREHGLDRWQDRAARKP